MEKKNFKILYVDDEEHNLISFKAAFRREYEVSTAISGKDGISIVKNEDINLIITDQRMPEMTGIQFLEKTIPEYPHIIRMVLTGFSDVEAIIGAINTGRVFRYITKPWDEKELRMTIENARQLYELQKRNLDLMTELKQKVEDQEKTLKLFVKYVPEPVVKKALSASEESMFDGEQRNVTVLFIDIREFTSISENLLPKEVVSLLNDYYSIMTEIVKRHHGTVNQYVGDEVFAVFGAPMETENNERNAVYCAIDMIKKLEQLNNKYQQKFNREIKVGIGINAGEAVAGNLGSEEKIDYSITGDTVNTGKRIETITQDESNKILISNSVYQKVHDLFNISKRDSVYVKGKKNKLEIYEVLNEI
ncbi:adenylate/guanylate cyclase domain-containing protein [Bacteroidota bacterium]